MSGPDRLAVYGTLVPGGANEDVLATIGGEWTAGTVRGTRLEDGWHGYPGLVLGRGGDVRVAVLTSSALADAWDRLDDFEGPGYRRVVTEVRLADGDVVPAHVYVLAETPEEMQGSGNGAT